MGHNVSVFLWRSLLVQAMRRHYVATSLELLFVAVNFLFVVFLRQAPVPLSRGSNGTELDSYFVSRRPTHVVFGPDTSYNRMLMEAVVAAYSDYDDKLVLSMAPKVSLVGEVAKHCAQIEATHQGRLFPMCVALETPADKESPADASLKYTIFKPFDHAVSDKRGFTTSYMYAIEQAHLKLQWRYLQPSGKDSVKDMKIVVEDLPGWVFSGMNVGYRSEFTVTLYVVFMIPAIRRINAIEYELSSGLAEKQALMGLSAVQFVVGHFLTAMAFYLVETATVITFMYAIKVGWNHVPYAYGIDPGMVFISFLLFDVGQALIPVYVTSVCPRGWVRMLLFLGLVIVTPGLFFGALSPETVPEYLTTTRRSKLLMSILPHSGLVSVMMVMFLAQDYEDCESRSLSSPETSACAMVVS